MRSLALIALFLSACTTGVKIQEPTTTRPAAPARSAQPNGAIFQDTSYRPLFEDRRARYVGDTLVVVINEKTTASRSGDLSASRDSSVDMSVGNVQRLGIANPLQGTALSAAAKSNIDTKDAASANNLFTGSIMVTVTDVLPNGNLVVSGEKRLGINEEIETLRFSGVVNPVHVINNTVSSTNVADARIEADAHSHVEGERVLGFLGRFFLSFLPFR